ncbi:uncharacterized protein TRAVEDRAFT_74059 [Trametes versicolor FP-101664 SS1]|uniref:uncharacterized protein n=1 Tax=Trametes versicolor (strain FP-101664) TaxID=717944 RepID=UPI0004621A6D|nr:uncharacterized protein TRAVEDRAFT_74059 [Trametes versicolor FP-101664 SS1]EIW55099.1 hypothetical protein TRAVEDRAFT_74059 [Trametes versicolor FP-101664 SS1]
MGSSCDVYTKLLFKRGHGHPLWEPEPTEDAGEVLIGDVGHIYRGGFYRIFNAMLPPDHSFNQPHGVPEGHKPPIFPDCLRQRRAQAIGRGPICSRNVAINEIQGALSVGTAASAAVSFKCLDEQGAVLVMKHEGTREVILPCDTLTEYIKINHQSWYRFARDVFMLDIKEEDLIFVRGWVKTGQWAVAAATHHAKGGEFSFSGNFSSAVSAVFSVRTDRETCMSIESRAGPAGSSSAAEGTPAFDQCVFLHYYKLKRNKFLPIKSIRAEAGPHSLKWPHEAQPNAGAPVVAAQALDESLYASEEDVVMEEGDGSDSDEPSQVDDPVVALLDYMLQADPRAECAIATDGDLADLFPNGSMPDDVHAALMQEQPALLLNEVVTLPVHAFKVPASAYGGDAPHGGSFSTAPEGPFMEAADSSKMTGLVIMNIAYTTKREALLEIIASKSIPTPVLLKYNLDQLGQFNGLAFAYYSQEADAAAALTALEGLEVHGRPLRVRYKHGTDTTESPQGTSTAHHLQAFRRAGGPWAVHMPVLEGDTIPGGAVYPSFSQASPRSTMGFFSSPQHSTISTSELSPPWASSRRGPLHRTGMSSARNPAALRPAAAAIHSLVQGFKDDPLRDELPFSRTMDSTQRHIVEAAAQEFGLCYHIVREGSEGGYAVVTKPDAIDDSESKETF